MPLLHRTIRSRGDALSFGSVGRERADACDAVRRLSKERVMIHTFPDVEPPRRVKSRKFEHSVNRRGRVLIPVNQQDRKFGPKPTEVRCRVVPINALPDRRG